jgi:hypothetical protein
MLAPTPIKPVCSTGSPPSRRQKPRLIITHGENRARKTLGISFVQNMAWSRKFPIWTM